MDVCPLICLYHLLAIGICVRCQGPAKCCATSWSRHNIPLRNLGSVHPSRIILALPLPMGGSVLHTRIETINCLLNLLSLAYPDAVVMLSLCEVSKDFFNVMIRDESCSCSGLCFWSSRIGVVKEFHRTIGPVFRSWSLSS